jgi:prepilin signal peptidase PulO-like enzyme (type II secretory pathway)
MIVILLSDLRHWRVPLPIVLIGAGWGLCVGAFTSEGLFFERAFGAIFGFTFLWCVLVVSTHLLRSLSYIAMDEFAMGTGDPWLLAVIGANMGVLHVPGVLFLASMQGIIAFLGSRLSSHLATLPSWPNAHRHSVPFGTFLCLAALELSIWPDLVAKITSFIRSLN